MVTTYLAFLETRFSEADQQNNSRFGAGFFPFVAQNCQCVGEDWKNQLKLNKHLERVNVYSRPAHSRPVQHTGEGEFPLVQMTKSTRNPNGKKTGKRSTFRRNPRESRFGVFHVFGLQLGHAVVRQLHRFAHAHPPHLMFRSWASPIVLQIQIRPLGPDAERAVGSQDPFCLRDDGDMCGEYWSSD